MLQLEYRLIPFLKNHRNPLSTNICKEIHPKGSTSWSNYGLAKIKKLLGSNIPKFSPNFIAANVGSYGQISLYSETSLERTFYIADTSV